MKIKKAIIVALSITLFILLANSLFHQYQYVHMIDDGFKMKDTSYFHWVYDCLTNGRFGILRYPLLFSCIALFLRYFKPLISILKKIIPIDNEED